MRMKKSRHGRDLKALQLPASGKAAADVDILLATCPCKECRVAYAIDSIRHTVLLTASDRQCY